MTLLALDITPRLARSTDTKRPSLAPGFGASTAFINLSPGLMSVFDAPGHEGLSLQSLGAAGLTAQQAWNAAAAGLAPRATRPGGIEFSVRCPTVALSVSGLPPGFEVEGHGVPAAAWLAHPRTFTLLNNHFRAVMQPRTGLTYLSRDDRELFVFDAYPETLLTHFPRAAVMTYSIGFPLLHKTRALPRDGTALL